MYEKRLEFSAIEGIDQKRYGFLPIYGNPHSVAFSIYKSCVPVKFREFAKYNFAEFSRAFYKAMEFDSIHPRSRKRKLNNFLKSIFEQELEVVSLLMIKAVDFLINEGKDEESIISDIICKILPNGGFKKHIIDKRYIWKIDEKIKFKKSIGKAFVLNYIKNKFDKDSVWKWVKKYCYMNAEGCWVYKDETSKEKLLNSIRPFIKNGGILVKENMSNDFDAFVPLKVLSKTEDGKLNFVLSKAIDGTEDKEYFIEGVASNTNIDREDERVSEKFISKMKKEAVGLPIFLDTHYPNNPDNTIGVIQRVGGDKKTFEIYGQLESPESNDYVKKVLSKMALSIRYGFSVGGKITKAFREFNEKLGKEVIVLDDGQLHHVVLTNQPCNPTTFAESMAKSLSDDFIFDNESSKGKDKDLSKVYSIPHRSALSKSEPEVEDVLSKVSSLPDTAFPINRTTHEADKGYPHHFVDDGQLYLHKALLVEQYKKAIKSNADKTVIAHLKTHLMTIGLSKSVEEINGLIKSVENFEEISELSTNMVKSLRGLFKSVGNVKNLKVGKEEKMEMLKKSISDVSTELTEILENVELED